MRTLAAIGLLLVPSAAIAAIHEVEVPAHIRWCKSAHVTEQDAKTPGAVDAIVHRTVTAIEECARAAKMVYAGIPFNASSTETKSGGEITLCEIVSGDAEPPCAEANVTRVAVAPQRVVAAVCRESEAENCEKEISDALQMPPFGMDEVAIARLGWRFAQPSIATEDEVSSIINALTDASANRVDQSGADVKARVPPAVIVVAVPVPSSTEPTPTPPPDPH